MPVSHEIQRAGRRASNAGVLVVGIATLVLLAAGVYGARHLMAMGSPMPAVKQVEHRHTSMVHDTSPEVPVIISSERLVIGENSLMNSTDTTKSSVTAGVSFARYAPFPSADSFVNDPHFNILNIAVGPALMAELEEVIRTANKRMSILEVEKVRIAELWARTRMDHGDYVPLARGISLEAGPPGTLVVAIVDAGADISKAVTIHPGEYAELDLIAQEMESLAQSVHAKILTLLSQ